MQNMDPLTELPIAQWPMLQEKLLRNWPVNIAGYYALKKNQEYPKMREAFRFKVYCPFGDMDNGFVATSMRGHITCMILSPVTEDTSKLEQALPTSKAIDWTTEVEVTDVSSEAIAIVKRLKQVIGLEYTKDGAVKMFYLDHKTFLLQDMTLPDRTFISQVKQEDIARVSETWFKDVYASYTYFSNLVSIGFSYGLYSQNKLLAWLFTSEHNVLQHLYCEEGNRGMGYGEHLLKYAINDQVRQGNDVYCFATEDNQRSIKLLKKVGFKPADNFYYATVTAWK